MGLVTHGGGNFAGGPLASRDTRTSAAASLAGWPLAASSPASDSRSAGSRTRCAPLVTLASTYGATPGHTSWTSRRKMLAPVGPTPGNSVSREAMPPASPPASSRSLRRSPCHFPASSSAPSPAWSRCARHTPVVAAAQRVHPVLPAGLAHRLRAPVAGREQLARGGDRGFRRDGRAQQRGQDEQLVEGARAVGQPDAGVLGVQPPVPGEQLPDDRFRLACHA